MMSCCAVVTGAGGLFRSCAVLMQATWSTPMHLPTHLPNAEPSHEKWGAPVALVHAASGAGLLGPVPKLHCFRLARQDEHKGSTSAD